MHWTSKYGSVIAVPYNAGAADGMNAKGLVANLLYLTESDYGKPDEKHKLISITMWAQYVLDNFATVDETVNALKAEPFQIVAPTLPNGSASSLHLAISDASGGSAIFEYIDGKLVIQQKLSAIRPLKGQPPFSGLRGSPHRAHPCKFRTRSASVRRVSPAP